MIDNDADRDWLFFKLLQDSKIQLVSLAHGKPHSVVFFDHYWRSYLSSVRAMSGARRVLVCREPRAVKPLQYKKWVRSLYDQVIVISELQKTSSRDLVYFPGFFPGPRLGPHQAPKNKGSVGIVNANKFSFVSGSLYKTRHSSISKLAKSGIETHLAGANWDKHTLWHIVTQIKTLALNLADFSSIDCSNLTFPLPKLANLVLHGAVDDSVDFLSKYEFALVVENDPDYISEKLFNAIYAGSIPIYVGPDLGIYDLPREIAIPLASLQSNDLDHVILPNSEVSENSKRAAEAWLARKDTTDFWSHDAGVARLLAAVLTAVDG